MKHQISAIALFVPGMLAMGHAPVARQVSTGAGVSGNGSAVSPGILAPGPVIIKDPIPTTLATSLVFEIAKPTPIPAVGRREELSSNDNKKNDNKKNDNKNKNDNKGNSYKGNSYNGGGGGWYGPSTSGPGWTLGSGGSSGWVPYRDPATFNPGGVIIPVSPPITVEPFPPFTASSVWSNDNVLSYLLDSSVKLNVDTSVSTGSGTTTVGSPTVGLNSQQQSALDFLLNPNVSVPPATAPTPLILPIQPVPSSNE